MERILESLTFGHFALVHEKPTNSQETTVCGFTIAPLEDYANILVAPNGDKFGGGGLRFANAENIKLLLCDTDDDTAGICDNFQRIFDEQEVIVAARNENLVFFAPICRTEDELVDFFLELDNCIYERHTKLPYAIYDTFVDFATWLYKNNPDKQK